MRDIRIIIANNIRAERSRKKLSQEDVANYLNIARETYIGFENGNRIDSYYIYQLSKLFECDIANFYIGLDTTNCGNKE